VGEGWFRASPRPGRDGYSGVNHHTICTFCQIGFFNTSKNFILSRHHHFLLFLVLVAIPASCLDTGVQTAPTDEGISESEGVFQFKQRRVSQKNARVGCVSIQEEFYRALAKTSKLIRAK
jgi:hypothetical protein